MKAHMYKLFLESIVEDASIVICFEWNLYVTYKSLLLEIHANW
jgi:hypothetical protein